MSTLLTGQEVAEQLRRAIRGEVTIRLAPEQKETWDECWAGSVMFLVGDWRIQLFNDCDSIDYCDDATSPDGRYGAFDDWWQKVDDEGNETAPGTEPIRYSIAWDDQEFKTLERLLKAATR